MGEFNYVPSGFSKKDFWKLYKETDSSFLRSILRDSYYRDKRIQRVLMQCGRSDALKALMCPVSELPLYMETDRAQEVQDIIKWRFSIGR